jgi:hypothetical protein
MRLRIVVRLTMKRPSPFFPLLAMFHELNHPAFVEVIDKASDVRVQNMRNPCEVSCLDTNFQKRKQSTPAC